MPLSLAFFPAEILSNIFARLSASQSYPLIFVSGDRLLKDKSLRRGLLSLPLADYCLKRGLLKEVANFTCLVRLSIAGIEYSKPLELHLLPSTLLHLDVHSCCQHWLASETDPAHVHELAYVTLGSSRIFNFKRHFHKLQHLVLACHNHTETRTLVHDNSMLVLRLLPDTLETLFLSHLSEVHPRLWVNLPRGLKITEMNEWVTNKFVESVALHAPHVHIGSLPLYEDPRAISTVTHYPFASASLFIGDVHTPTSELDARLLGLSSLFSSATPSSEYPPASITALRGRGWPSVSEVLKVKPESVKWPSTLLVLDDIAFTQPSWIQSNCFPSTLTELQIGLKPQLGPISFPPKLTSLVLSYDINDSDPRKLFEALPHTLVTFKVHLTSTKWEDEWLTSLPRARLITFDLKCTSEMNITDQFVALLPKSIGYFMTSGVCVDTALPVFVKRLVEFLPSAVDFTGALIRPDATYFDFSLTSCWKRYDDCSLSHDLHEHPSGPKLRFRILTLPSTLTHLKISSIDPTLSKFENLTIPSLTKIELPKTTSIFWSFWTLPSLTSLVLLSGTEPSHAPTGFPSTITHLRCETSMTGSRDYATIPAFLHPHVKVLSSNGVFHFQIIPPSVHTLEMKELARWPNESTSLVDLKLFNYNDSFNRLIHFKSIFPNLRKFSTLPTGDWHLKYADLIADRDMELIECRTVSQAPLDLTDDHIIQEQIESGSVDIAAVVALQLRSKFSYLKLPPDARACGVPLAMVDFKHLQDLWSNSNVTSLILSSVVITIGKFGKFLPSTLTHLELLDVLGLDSGTTKHFPRGITELKMRHHYLSRDAYRWLPVGLISLSLDVDVFNRYHASALPSGLQSLTLKYTKSQPRTLSHLPHSLTRLEIDSQVLPQYLSYGLPSSLLLLKLNLQCYHPLVDWEKIRTGSPRIKIEYGLAPFGPIGAAINHFLPADDLIDSLSLVEI